MGGFVPAGGATILHVGVGWYAPLRIMSVQLRLWDDGTDQPDDRLGVVEFRARLGREIAHLLTISTRAGGVGRLSPTGLAHSLTVCLIEDWHMSRGKSKSDGKSGGGTLPRFVDVKLTAEERDEFTSWPARDGNLVTFLQSMADDGYRVGVAWSGEQQAYVVSLTCRAEGNVNSGLCMTSFARTLETALWLALYKHLEVTGEKWLEGGFGGDEDFG